MVPDGPAHLLDPLCSCRLYGVCLRRTEQAVHHISRLPCVDGLLDYDVGHTDSGGRARVSSQARWIQLGGLEQPEQAPNRYRRSYRFLGRLGRRSIVNVSACSFLSATEHCKLICVSIGIKFTSQDPLPSLWAMALIWAFPCLSAGLPLSIHL